MGSTRRVDRELPQGGQRDGRADRVTGRDADVAFELVLVDAHDDRGLDPARRRLAVQAVRGECHEGVGTDLRRGAVIVRTLAPRLERRLHLRVEEGAQEPSGNRRELATQVSDAVGVLGQVQGSRVELSAFAALQLHGIKARGLGAARHLEPSVVQHARHPDEPGLKLAGVTGQRA